MSGKPVESGSLDVLKRNLRSALPILEQNGIVGLIEPINKYSVPGYFLNDFEIGNRYVRNILPRSICKPQIIRGKYCQRDQQS